MSHSQRSLKRKLDSLSEPERLAVRAALLGPVASLADRIGRLEAPFRYLAEVEACFDPTPMLLIKHAARGDRQAIEAIGEYSRAGAAELLAIDRESPPSPNLVAFEAAHKEEWTDMFLRRERLNQRGSELVSTFDEQLCKAVEDHLRSHGFRACSRGFRSDLLESPLYLKTNKGALRPTVYLFLELPTFATQFLIGVPFFYSALALPKCPPRSCNIVEETLFELGRIFPNVVAALDDGCRVATGQLLCHKD